MKRDTEKFLKIDIFYRDLVTRANKNPLIIVQCLN